MSEVVLVNYEVKPEHVETIKRAISEFIAGIQASEPNTFYEAFQQVAKPTAFTHFMIFNDIDAKTQHQDAPHTKKFVDILYPACTLEPVFTDLAAVASTSIQRTASKPTL